MNEVDAEEFAWWIAYYEIQPWGNDREDLRAGMIGAVMANAWRGKRGKRIGPEDLFPNLKPPAAIAKANRPTPEQLAAKLRWITWAMGGKFVTAGAAQNPAAPGT